MAPPKRSVVALAAGIGRGGVEISYPLVCRLLNHRFGLLALPKGAKDSFSAEAHLADGRAALSK